MKGILRILGLLGTFVFIVPLFAEEPGGTRTWYAYFDVTNQDGLPLSGISIELQVTTWYGDELDPEYYTCYKTGFTDSDGWAYLECVIPGEFAEGLAEMRARITDLSYTIYDWDDIYTYTNQAIWPVFVLLWDPDDNGVLDSWELPLAQKFCPYLILDSRDNGVRPVPVESMDINGDNVLGWEDVLVNCYNIGGNLVGVLQMNQIYIYGLTPQDDYWYDERYPRIAAAEKHQAWPYGAPPNIYFFAPHFEWGPIGSTTPTTWYSSWSWFIQAHASETAYVDGTTYAHLFTKQPLGDETVIQYWFFYPFNASANRHEGDWEHINVVLDDQDPSAANIIRVEYYFHQDVAPRYTPGVDYYLVDGTHPKVYVGGRTDADGYAGNGTHGSYPFDGDWPNINVIGTDETVDGLGLHINFANYQNIILLPNAKAVASGNPLEWMHFGGYWGYPISYPSAGDNITQNLFSITNQVAPNIPIWQPWLSLIGYVVWGGFVGVGIEIIDDSKLAPIGPAFKANTWNKVYSQTGLHVYTAR